MSTDNPIQLFTVSETAELLRLSVSKVYRMLGTGELPCVQIGTRKLVAFDDLRHFLAMHRVEPNALPVSTKRHF